MARKVRDSSLDTRAARARLKTRGKPYYRLIAPGLHIGYRKPLSGDGRWVVRDYRGNGRYEVKTIDGVADDHNDANGKSILNFAQAQERARLMAARVHDGDSTAMTLLTVREAIESYIEERDRRDSERDGRPVNSDAAQRLRRYVLGQEARGMQEAIKKAPLADVEMQALEDSDLLQWRRKLPADLKATTKQRLINDLKAALNASYQRHRKRLPSGFKETIKYGLKAEGAKSASSKVRENQILTDAQITALLRAAKDVDDEEQWEGDLYRLVVVLAATGARYSQISRMRVGDCQAAQGRLLVPVSRKGRGEKASDTKVPVEAAVLEALRPVVVGRSKDDWLLERWHKTPTVGGKWELVRRRPWGKSDIQRPWAAIRKRAGMPKAIPYSLRHSSIVRGIRENLPIRLVAALHDTSVQMIERHYSHFIADGLEELAAKAVVPLVPKDAGGKVLPMRGR